MSKKERYIQVGVTAMRERGTGKFLPAVPLFVRADDVDEGAEESLVEDIAALFAQRMRRYKEACEAAGAAV